MNMKKRVGSHVNCSSEDESCTSASSEHLREHVEEKVGNFLQLLDGIAKQQQQHTW